MGIFLANPATSSRPTSPTFSTKAEDPAKMIRMIFLEKEETLVEVRASAARTNRRPEGDAAPHQQAREAPGELDREGRAGA